MISNKELSNNLFDYLYDNYNLNVNMLNVQISEEEKNVICKNFYFLLPFIYRDMSKRQQEIITLTYGYNKKQTDIAKMLNISQSNVSIHLNAAYCIINRYFEIIYRSTIFALRYEKRKD